MAMVSGVCGGPGVRGLLGGAIHAGAVVRAVADTATPRGCAVPGGESCGSGCAVRRGAEDRRWSDCNFLHSSVPRTVTTSSQLSTPRPDGWVSVTLPLTGEVSVTNTGTRPNPAAASVVVEYSVGYPTTSRVCQLMSDPEMPNRDVAGGFCWRSAGTATLFSYSSGPPISIEPGAGFGTDIGEYPNEVSVSVDVPVTEVDDSIGLVSRPAVIVATTNDIPGLGTSFQFAGACIDPTHSPTSPSGPTPSMVAPSEQHAVIGATRYLTCGDLPDLGN